MDLIKSVITLFATLIALAAGIDGLESVTKWMAGEAVKTHQKGIVSLRQWNSKLHYKHH